ncbi:hypothetical protein BDP55DRAFT_649573 [Colletotrichum godetiae]|uniref:Uncharacterized protein n=1 Tax=Colletotrichum godetiae TaxID=1209918 RepID=A0AAJ0AYB7_9PEZI|nr:uncharacterized protein BDP55DRAFT_649573 [Colletotrichum godetiae]KAK1691100.1 hypothetical protein BDP55DRAFT_649573 [Colletotrichum godetiae]
MRVHLEQPQCPLPRPHRRESNSSDTPKILLHEDRRLQGNAQGFRALLSRIIRGKRYQGLWRFTMRLSDPCWRDLTTDIDFEWRHSRGLLIRTLRLSDGWLLWRKRTPDETRILKAPRQTHLGQKYIGRGGHARLDEELVAMISIDPSRPYLGTGFRFLNSAAVPPDTEETSFLNDDFSLVAIMSGIGIILGETETLGGVLTSEEIQASQRPHLKRAALVEKHAREAKEWLATLDLMDENDHDDEPSHLLRAEKVSPWRGLHGSGAALRGREGGVGQTKGFKGTTSAERRQRSLSAPETSSRRRSSQKSLNPEPNRRQVWEKRPTVYVPMRRERTANASAATRRTTPLRSSQRSSYGDRDPTSPGVVLAQGMTRID